LYETEEENLWTQEIPSFLPQMNPHPNKDHTLYSNPSLCPFLTDNIVQSRYGKLAGPRLVTKFSTLYGNKVTVRSKAWVWGRSTSGVIGSNPNVGKDVCILWVMCVVRYRFLRRADHPSRGVYPSVVCISVIAKPREGRNWHGIGPMGQRKKIWKQCSSPCKQQRVVYPYFKSHETSPYPKNLFLQYLLYTSSISAPPFLRVNIN
jgi:hypothetical protein